MELDDVLITVRRTFLAALYLPILVFFNKMIGTVGCMPTGMVKFRPLILPVKIFQALAPTPQTPPLRNCWVRPWCTI